MTDFKNAKPEVEKVSIFKVASSFIGIVTIFLIVCWAPELINLIKDAVK
jgi:hypothetical protein